MHRVQYDLQESKQKNGESIINTKQDSTWLGIDSENNTNEENGEPIQ